MRKKTVSGPLFALLLLGMLMLAFNIRPVKAGGTIYIRPDGTVEGTDKIQRDGDVYTFTDNIYDEVVVEIDNIVIDGAGHTLHGAGIGYGMDLTGRNNVTITNIEIKSFLTGVMLYESADNTISGNSITDTDYGIDLRSNSNNNSISGNTITHNDSGIDLWRSANNNDISGNTVTSNNHFGILLFESANNSISGNTITSNKYDGIYLGHSANNGISGNNITHNRSGIRLYRSANNGISGNTITSNNGSGIDLLFSANNNSILRNNVTDNRFGVDLHESANNSISSNTITHNDSGIHLVSANNNVIYHNNFVNNSDQVYTDESVNVWDDGYPSGGNYWSDYTGEDVEGDGIGDTPNVIDENNQDDYPLMSPWSPETPAEVLFWTQWWFWAIAAAGIAVSVGAVYFLKKKATDANCSPTSFRRHRCALHSQTVKFPAKSTLMKFHSDLRQIYLIMKRPEN